MSNVYQHLPSIINPVAFKIGGFEIRWYALMYLLAFAVVYLLLIYRLKKKEANYRPDFVPDLLLAAILGMLSGGRLGFVFFYDPVFFWHNPLAIISPWNASGSYVGIFGMSYYGGVIGIILAGIIFCKKYRINFWQLADFVVPAIPAGYFFGRLGNFLNGELFGRATDRSWGMYFADGILRHPSQLYEAFFEGLVLFIFVWLMRNKVKFPGQLLAFYLFGYGFLRFFIEFFREPDPQVGLFLNFLTLGQIFSAITMASMLALYFRNKQKMIDLIK